MTAPQKRIYSLEEAMALMKANPVSVRHTHTQHPPYTVMKAAGIDWWLFWYSEHYQSFRMRHSLGSKGSCQKADFQHYEFFTITTQWLLPRPKN